MRTRHFRDLLNDLKNKYKDDKPFDKEDKYVYPHKRRFVIMVDRRPPKKSKEEEKLYYMDSKEERNDKPLPTEEEEKKARQYFHDKMYMYEAPSDCSLVPNNPVVEWGISASKACVLPNMKYGEKTIDQKGDTTEKKSNSQGKEKDNEKYVNSNIGAASHCKGSLLTLSFHVIERDIIRCYLWWNGQMIQFMPNDLKNVLPKLFYNKWQPPQFEPKSGSGQYPNQFFMKETNNETKKLEIDELVSRMIPIIRDEHFNNFQAWCNQINTK